MGEELVVLEGQGQDARLFADEVGARDVADDSEGLGPDGDVVLVLTGGALGGSVVPPAIFRATQVIDGGEFLRAVTESADHERLLPEA